MKKPKKLLSINLGLPQDLEINGKITRTAILKKPVDHPVMIHISGPEGDKRAVHPDAVYAISGDHYDYWARELSADRSKWDYGHFGENLTIEGFDEEGMHLGDILHIGETVKLQLVSPRVPCSKFSWRMHQDANFLRRFSLSGKTGFYLKVLQTGQIQAGDSIQHEVLDPEAITIAELSRHLVNINEASEEELYKLLSHEHLGLTAQGISRTRLATLKDLELMRSNRWQGWSSAEIYKIEPESKDVLSFWIRLSDQMQIAGYRPGQFLTCRLNIDGEELIRTWTISQFEPESKSYRISVKKLAGGKASTYLHENCSEGMKLEIKPPNGSFSLDRSTGNPIVLISAGIGITPMISMLKGHLERSLQPVPPLYFLYVTQNKENHPFADEVEELIQGQERMKRLRFYTHPSDTDEITKDYDINGNFSSEILENLMEGNQVYWGDRWHDWPKQEAHFYLCGPLGFQNFVTEELKGWGVKEEYIFTESFNPSSGEAVGIKPESAKVIFSKSGIRADWSELEDLTLLELAEKHGIDAPNACRMGVCETCECVLQAGEVYYEHGPLAKRCEQSVLICCAKPGSKRLEIEI
jgi:ferredoxin-NADP reductase/MOSC domain-containing protein YiiM